MAIKYAFNVLDILSYPLSTVGPIMIVPGEKIFKIKALRWLGNAILRLVFAHTVFHKRAILLIFEAEATNRAL